LAGELDLTDFAELKEIHISYYLDEKELKFKNKPQNTLGQDEVKIIKCSNAKQ